MAPPEIKPQTLDPEEYSLCRGLDVKLDATTQTAYLTIDRGLELPVKVGIQFGPLCLLVAGVLQMFGQSGGPQNEKAVEIEPPGLGN